MDLKLANNLEERKDLQNPKVVFKHLVLVEVTMTGAAEQVKPVKPGLHRKSEVLLERNF